MADEIQTERTGGAYEIDAKGKLKRTEPEMRLPEIPQPESAPENTPVDPAPAVTTETTDAPKTQQKGK